jgi:thiamine-phosphate pyrophosphorylase
MHRNTQASLTRLAAQLNLRHPARVALPPLLLMSDAARLADPRAAARLLPRGSAVVLRNYGSPGRGALAAELAALCRARGLILLIGEDGALATEVGAHGLHFPEAQAARVPDWRRRRGDWIITVAAHSAPALARAARAGAGAAVLGPVFASASHLGAPSLGVDRFAALLRASPIPVYALGGIDSRGARRIACSGAIGIAALGALTPQAKPG